MSRPSAWNRCEVLFYLASLVVHEPTSPDIEKELGVPTPPLQREHPSSSLYDAAKLLIQTHARRLPLLDNDTETGHEVIVSVLTQYRLLKFISINVCFVSLFSSPTVIDDCIRFLVKFSIFSVTRKFNNYINH